MNALELRNLRKSFSPHTAALAGLDLDVPAGAIVGLIGLNGAGKSTTIKIIAGLETRDGGTVTFFGRPISRPDADMKRMVGAVLDTPLYFDWMPAGEYLRFVGAMYGVPTSEAARRVEELLAFFDLSPRSGDPIGSFSTGMKKKVSLAAALIHGPRFIMLDEPLDGIDPIAAGAIKDGLSLMASRGVTILITSHVLDTVERLCTHVAVVHRGATVLQCPTDQIRTFATGSLEGLFLELVAGGTRKPPLSWFRGPVVEHDSP